MHTNPTLPTEDSSPYYHPPLTCLFKVKMSYIYGVLCVALYIIPEAYFYKFCSNPVMIWTVTDSVPLARSFHTLCHYLVRDSL